jgi:hypothetical protein
VGTFSSHRKRWKNIRRGCIELAIPGVCPDRLDRENGEVRTFEENVLGPRGKLGLVHSNERAKELSPPRLKRAGFAN